jgi:hypothetical protein
MGDYLNYWIHGDGLSGFNASANGFGDGYEGNSIGSGHGDGMGFNNGNGFESGAGYSNFLKESMRISNNG